MDRSPLSIVRAKCTTLRGRARSSHARSSHDPGRDEERARQAGGAHSSCPCTLYFELGWNEWYSDTL